MKNQSFIASLEIFRRLLPISLITIPFAFSGALCQAQVIFQHLGQNDPVVAEGWTYMPIAAGPNALTPGNDGVDYWDINCTAGGSLYYHVGLPSSDFTDPSGWTATLRAKVNEANAADLRAIMSAADGNGNSWAYTLGGGGGDTVGVFYLDPNANPATISTSVNPTSAYHYYQIIYPGSGGSATADFYVDGVLGVTLNRTQALGSGTSIDSGMYWGGVGTAGDSSDVQYAEVKLEYGSHPYVPPSAIQSQSPAPNAINVSPSASINITLIDGATPVLTNDIQLSLNNAIVSPTISKPSNITTITYQPPGSFALSSSNAVTLVFNDTASTLVTNTWSFTVASNFIFIEHVGSNNPTTEGFTYNQISANPIALTPGNDGMDYWDVVCPPTGSVYYHVNLPSSDFTDSSGWTATLEAKVNQSDAASSSLRSILSAADGDGNSWAYVLGGGPNESPGDSGVFYLDPGQNSTRISTSVDPTSGYHYYQVIYPGSGGSGTADFYVDGVLGITLNRTQALGAGTGTDSGIYWGGVGTGLSGGDYSDVQYALVSLQLGQHPYVPPTSTIISQNPAPNAIDVSPATAINITVLDGTTPVLTNDIQLYLNNVAVSPTISKPANITTINYQPPVSLALSSSNTVTLIFNGPASTLVTNTWGFTVASQFILIEHIGQNNPTTEGFTYIPFGAATTLTPGNDGTDYWDVNSPASGGAYYHAALPSSDFTDPSGWTATLRAKVNQADAPGLRSILSAADGDGNSWAYTLGGGGSETVGVFYLDPNANAAAISTSVNPTSDYHYYQVVYPGSGGSATADFYVDGVLGVTLNRTQALGSGTSTDSGIYWGGVSSGLFGGDYSDVQYALVSLQLGQHPVASETPPTLAVSQSGTSLNFSWNAAGFVLQTNGNLSNPSGWANVPGGTISPQAVPIGAGNLFFRLGQQH